MTGKTASPLSFPRLFAFSRPLACSLLVLGLAAFGGAMVSAQGQTAPATAKPAQPQTAQQQPPSSTSQVGPAAGEGRRGYGPPSHDGSGRGSGPGGTDFFGWWKDPDIIKEIGLTQDQAARIDRIYALRNKQIDPFVHDYDQQRSELDRMMRERTADPSLIELQASKMFAPKMKVDESRVVMLYRMNLVLTADQAKKLQAIFERDHDRGGRGRGRNPALR